MNEYRIGDITEGMSESFTVTITDRMMEAFRDITGDDNPLHTDADYAKDCGYEGCVSYGMLTASFLSTLTAEHVNRFKKAFLKLLFHLLVLFIKIS